MRDYKIVRLMGGLVDSPKIRFHFSGFRLICHFKEETSHASRLYSHMCVTILFKKVIASGIELFL
jgi:hypothetical protein